jgi:hypothetical protein
MPTIGINKSASLGVVDKYSKYKEGLTVPEVFHCVGAVIFLTEATLSEAEAGGSLES